MVLYQHFFSVMARVRPRGLGSAYIGGDDRLAIPAVPEENIAETMVTRMGLCIYYDELIRRDDPKGRPYYWIGSGEPGGVLREGTDLWAVANGHVVAPLQLDLTAHGLIEQVEG